MLQRTRRGSSWVLRSRDTLDIVPIHDGDTLALRSQRERFAKEKPLIASHDFAVQIARRWVDADPNSQSARFGLMTAALMRGDLTMADAQLQRVTPRVGGDNTMQLRIMMEVAAKRGRGTLARAIFDSLVKSAPDNPANALNRGSIDLMFGRLARDDVAAAAAGARIHPEVTVYLRHVGRALLGLPRDSLARDEAAFVASISVAACNDECRVYRANVTLNYSLHVPSVALASLVARDSAVAWIDAARALDARDTAQLRRAAIFLDTTARSRTSRAEIEANTVIS